MEFVEVVKQKGRMCDSNKQCSNCILSSYNNEKDIDCGTFMTTYPEKAEKIIMKWAEEHPVKTNKDKFYEIFSDFPLDIFEITKTCRANCASYPRCNGCNRKEAIEFWNKEYKEVEKDAVSN